MSGLVVGLLRAQQSGTSALSDDVTRLRFVGRTKTAASLPTVAVTNDTSAVTTMTSVRALPGTSYTSIVCTDTTKYTPLCVGGVAPTTGGSGALAAFQARFVGQPMCAIDFLFDGLEFEACVRQSAGLEYRLMVDGEYITQYCVGVGGTANSYGNIKVTFAARAVRRITIEFSSGDGGGLFLGCWLKTTDTMRATSLPHRRLIVAGDSYAGSSPGPLSSFPMILGRCLGFSDISNAGVGVTGWLAGGANKMASRLAADVTDLAPTDVVYALGHNDTSFSNAAIAAEVASVLASTRAALPNLRSLVVVGPLFAGGSPGVYAAMGAEMSGAALAAGADAYIDTTTDPIFTGTGRVGATAGDGNSDLNIASDGTHPTAVGSDWLGVSLAHKIATALAS